MHYTTTSPSDQRHIFLRQKMYSIKSVMVNKNTHTMTRNNCFDILRTFCIDDHVIKLYNQNKNLEERRSGGLKSAILKLFYNSPTNDPMSQLIFGAMYLNFYPWSKVVAQGNVSP